MEQQPSWSEWSDAFRIIMYPPYLKRSIRTALFVGTVLFLLNHFDVVLRGEANAAVWLKAVGNCVVPFCVSNWGILIATRRKPAGKE
jgi:hypothetical protein